MVSASMGATLRQIGRLFGSESVNSQITPESIPRDRQAANHLREIEPLPERHFFDTFHELFQRELRRAA